MVEVAGWFEQASACGSGADPRCYGRGRISMSLSKAELAYLTSQRLGRLATMHPDGTLQVNPVGFRYNPRAGTIDIGGFNMASSRKFRRYLLPSNRNVPG